MNGVVIAQGGRFGGWTVYFQDGNAKFVYNVLGIHAYSTAAEQRSLPAPIRCAWSSPTTGVGWPREATSLSTTTGTQSARNGDNTQPMIFSGDETTDIGQETGTTVSPDYTAKDSRFTGKINWVQIDLGADDHDHFIDPEERLRLAMARQ